jgi:hypothetical protein
MKIFLEVPKSGISIAFSEHSFKMWDQMQKLGYRIHGLPSSLSLQEKLIKRQNH